jgi:hypothetical protein
LRQSGPSKSIFNRRVDVNFDATQSRFAVFFEQGAEDRSQTNGISISSILTDGESISSTPTPSSSGNVTFDILANGDISVVGQNIVPSLDFVKKESETSPKEPKKQESENMQVDEAAVERLQMVSKSLDIAGDLNVWIVWMSSLKKKI